MNNRMLPTGVPVMGERPGLSQDPDWFRTAVFYEVLIRSFGDSQGSGSGDIVGLTQRLDYLQWLGVDCLWLPPFYPSPLADGGYDVADYTAVNPDFGTIDQLQTLIDEAHAHRTACRGGHQHRREQSRRACDRGGA